MSDHLTVGAFQFAGSGKPAQNLSALERGIGLAAKAGVRLLATQECALSGYPPVEVDSPDWINRDAQAAAVRRVAELAKRHRMYVALGMTTFHRDGARNTVRLVTPEGRLRRPYHKRALTGWDSENFVTGEGGDGVHLVDGVRVGLRICYEVRFPEYFRELFRRRVHLAIVSFADVGPLQAKYDVTRAHLISRAAENCVYILSANSISQPQLAPTCLIDPDGLVVCSAPKDREALVSGTVTVGPPPFGRRRRIQHSSTLC